MKIAAFDLSLTQTGYAITRDGQPTFGSIRSGTLRGMERIQKIRDTVLHLAAAADLVVLEGYSFASKGNSAVSLGELGGVIRLALYERGIPYVELAPATVKKLATGKGNAGKEDVLVAAVRRLDYPGANNNEADARWLLEGALQAYDLSLVSLPVGHRSAITAVTWPKIEPRKAEYPVLTAEQAALQLTPAERMVGAG